MAGPLSVGSVLSVLKTLESTIQFTVYNYLIFCCGSRDAYTVNIRTMAALCNRSWSSVKRALHELREHGFIDVKGDA